jgi:hypothetical protein
MQKGTMKVDGQAYCQFEQWRKDNPSRLEVKANELESSTSEALKRSCDFECSGMDYTKVPYKGVGSLESIMVAVCGKTEPVCTEPQTGP